MAISRSEFLKRGLLFLAGMGVAPRIIEAIPDKDPGLREAMYYTNLDEETVQCGLCPRGCVLGKNQRSFCRARECRNGRLYTLVYELPCAMHVDPIEKKPIFHMLPGSTAFSIATAGCNSRCKFCQNWQISQAAPEETSNMRVTCKEVVEKAIESGSKSIAYTYSEPTIFYEYALETARLAKDRGLKNIWVSGGFINPGPLREVAKYIDAAHIDFKAYDDGYLRDVCAQNLKVVTETIITAKREGVWIELINLIVPTLNDDFGKIEKMAVWIKENVGDSVPLHFSRFWPMYKLKNLPPTPVSTLEKARTIAMDAGLKFVYIGNVPGHDGNNTYCPGCKKLLVGRSGYLVTTLNISDSRCKFCDTPIPGIWR